MSSHQHEPDEHHHHHHGHSHLPKDFSRAFVWGIALNLIFVGAEAIFGTLAHSLALLADAGHNLSDVLGLALAWWASNLAKRPPTVRRTYGLRRASILAALANACVLLVAIGGIVWEALARFGHPHSVEGKTVMLVATLGIIINAVTALLFFSGRKGDLNIRGAYLHMAADAAVSLGVVLAGLLMFYSGALWIDPVVSLVIVAVIFYSTLGLLRDSLNLALDAVPRGINPEQVKAFLRSLPEVESVHDLHIWPMSTTETALTVHLVRKTSSHTDAFLATISQVLHEKFQIDHPTIQIETGEAAHACRLAPEEVV